MQQQKLQDTNIPSNLTTEIILNSPPAIYIFKIITNGKTFVRKVEVR